MDSETTKRSLVPDEPIPPPQKSVEGEKEAEEKAAKPASEGNEATAKQDEPVKQEEPAKEEPVVAEPVAAEPVEAEPVAAEPIAAAV